MRRHIIAFALAGAALLPGPALVLAHHGAATFDTEGEIPIRGGRLLGRALEDDFTKTQ